MKLETEKKKGEYLPLYVNVGDTAIITVQQGVAVKVAATTGKYPKAEHFALYMMAETNLEPDEIKPICWEIYDGKKPEWDNTAKAIKMVDCEVSKAIYEQLNDAEFPISGFKGLIRHAKDVKSLKGKNPIQDVEPVDAKELPPLPENKNGYGSRGPSFQPVAEIYESRKQFITNELKAILPEEMQELEFAELVKAAGITTPKDYLDFLTQLIR